MADMTAVSRLDGSRLEVGDRVVGEGQYAVIKFIGEVPPTKGVWLGVEWDDSSRGKHNGTHTGTGVSYFKTSHPTSGSFIRPNKIDGGITALEALHERYGLKEDSEAGVNTEELFVVDSFNNQTVVEMVGAKKTNLLQSQFNKLKKISFYSMAVYCAGPEGEMGCLCPHICDIDMSRCLLPSWERVAEIAQQFPHLKEINVSQNRLSIPKDPTSLATSFPCLRNLTMNDAAVTWEEVLSTCSMLPVLDELHVGFNNISVLSTDLESIAGLKTLDVMTNALDDWAEVLKLGKLPKLENLLVSENKMKSIFFPDCKPNEITEYFPVLKSLIIKRNDISEWSSINELNKLASLEELQLASNPIMTSHNQETVRQLIVAKIGRLKLISRTEILYDERKGAEIDYLKRFGTEWKKEGGSCDPANNKPSQGFVSNHPRFQCFTEKWGAPEDSELAEKSSALKDNLIAVKVFCAEHPQRGIMNKKLPGTMTIQKVKTLIQRLYKMSSEPKLTYKSHKISDGPEIELDNDMRHLGFFSIESGDSLLVSWG